MKTQKPGWIIYLPLKAFTKTKRSNCDPQTNHEKFIIEYIQDFFLLGKTSSVFDEGIMLHV